LGNVPFYVHWSIIRIVNEIKLRMKKTPTRKKHNPRHAIFVEQLSNKRSYYIKEAV